jgi:hypothetical protein
MSKNLKIRIYKTLILPIILYGCETWSLTLTEDYRVRVFENRVLRRIFGPKRNEVMGVWRELHKEVVHDLYSSPSIKRMRWVGHVVQMGEKRNGWESQRGKDH